MAKSRRMRKAGNRMKTNNPNAGLTLIEVLLSVSILAIVTLPLLNYFTSSMGYSVMMTERQKAAFLAQEITEGLLSEPELVVAELVLDDHGDPTVDASGNPEYEYKVPYFDDSEVNGTGTDTKLSYIRTDDVYTANVTITKPEGTWADIVNRPDYRIDPLTDVVHTDSDENSRAVFDLLTEHNNYVSAHPGATLPSGVNEEVSKADVEAALKRTITIDVTKPATAVDNEYKVKIDYEYECSKVVSTGGSSTGAWKTTVVDKTVKDLRNINIIYKPCEAEDEFILQGGNLGFSLGLYIIYQKKDDSDAGPSGIKLTTTGFQGKVFGYTNVGDGQLLPLGSDSSDTEPSAVAKSPLVYEINTKVYPKDHVDGDPLAEITAKKGE